MEMQCSKQVYSSNITLPIRVPAGLQFTASNTSVRFDTYGLLQVQIMFKQLAVTVIEKILGDIKMFYMDKRSGERNLIRQVVVNADNPSLDGIEAING